MTADIETLNWEAAELQLRPLAFGDYCAVGENAARGPLPSPARASLVHRTSPLRSALLAVQSGIM